MTNSPIRLFQKQKVAWDYLHNDKTTEVAYGGGAWWGKSLLWSLWLATQIANKPWSTWGIGRSELKKIKLSTFLTFKDMLRSAGFQDGSYKYDDQKSVMTFTNGCLVVLMDLNENPSDPNFDRLGSMEFTGFFIDEAQEVSGKAKQIVTSRLRNLTWKTFFYSKDKDKCDKWIKDNGKGLLHYNEQLDEYQVVLWIQEKPKLLLTLNPWRNFVYTDFYKPWYNDKNNGTQTLLSHRAFIQSLPTDNPFLPPAYVDNLRNLDKVSKERLLYGNFEYSDDEALLFSIDDISACFRSIWQNSKWLEVYLTIDAARQGRDNTVICIWFWLDIHKILTISKAGLKEQEDFINGLILKYGVDIDNVIVDEIWVWGGLVDSLGCRWFIANATALQPYSSKLLTYKKRNYANLKTQSFFYLQKYLPNISIYPECEFKEKIIEEALFIRQVDMDNDNKIKLESKKDLKEKLGRSPDYMDAISFRMWWIIKDHHYGNNTEENILSQEDKEDTISNFIQGLIDEEEENNIKTSHEPDFSIY